LTLFYLFLQSNTVIVKRPWVLCHKMFWDISWCGILPILNWWKKYWVWEWQTN